MKKNPESHYPYVQPNGAIRNGVGMLTSRDGVEAYEDSSKANVLSRYFASMHRLGGGQQIATDYPSATTRTTQLELTVEDTQRTNAKDGMGFTRLS